MRDSMQRAAFTSVPHEVFEHFDRIAVRDGDLCSMEEVRKSLMVFATAVYGQSAAEVRESVVMRELYLRGFQLLIDLPPIRMGLPHLFFDVSEHDLRTTNGRQSGEGTAMGRSNPRSHGIVRDPSAA